MSKIDDNADVRTCRPRKLGLPILGYNECIKSGINPMNFNNDYGCIGVVGTSSLVCEVSELYRVAVLNCADESNRPHEMSCNNLTAQEQQNFSLKLSI